MSSSRFRLRSSLSAGRNAILPGGETISTIAALDMLAHNWFLGFTSFGGPAVHYQIFRRLFVDKYQWIDEFTYLEIFALSQALSGPASTKMLYAFNVLHYGYWVGFLAFLVWSSPMAIAACGLALGVQSIGNELPAPVYALLSGLNSATVGIIALAAIQLSQKAVTDQLSRTLVFLSGAAGMLYNALWYFPVLMTAGGILTTASDLNLGHKLWRVVCPSRPEAGSSDTQHESSEVTEVVSIRSLSSLQSTRSQTTRHPAASSTQELPPVEAEPPEAPNRSRGLWKTGALVVATFFASFIIVMVCRGIYSDENRGFDLFANLYLAGTIIFGGGPVVVPLLREYVVAPGWVSSRDFLLGLAITQAFPGPNFNFAVYLGALAVQGSGLPPLAGSLIGFIAIFTPGIWLCAGFMELWATVRKVQAVRACLRGIHATAVGLVFTAVYRLFEIGYLDAEVQNGGSLGRDPWWVVIVATSLVGGMHFGLSPPVAIVLGGIMGLLRYAVVS